MLLNLNINQIIIMSFNILSDKAQRSTLKFQHASSLGGRTSCNQHGYGVNIAGKLYPDSSVHAEALVIHDFIKELTRRQGGHAKGARDQT